MVALWLDPDKSNEPNCSKEEEKNKLNTDRFFDSLTFCYVSIHDFEAIFIPFIPINIQHCLLWRFSFFFNRNIHEIYVDFCFGVNSRDTDKRNYNKQNKNFKFSKKLLMYSSVSMSLPILLTICIIYGFQ